MKTMHTCGACVAPALMLAFCVSCSSPPAQDNGLVGMIYHASRHPENQRVLQAEPRASAPMQSALTTGEGGAALPSYRISPGDVLAVSYYARPPSSESREYLVDSEDVLTITVSAQETTTTDVLVRPDGRISFHPVGEVDVRGKTVQTIQSNVAEHVTNMMPEAQVTVGLKKGNALTQAFLETLRGNLDTGSTRVLQVRQDGKVTFPLIGELTAAGKSMGGLAEALEGEYDRVLRGGLAVTLNLASSSEGSIAVLGEVRNPGRYSIVNPVNPFFALAMAGGALYSAKESKAVVVKAQPDGTYAWHVVNMDIDSGAPLGPDIPLTPKDMLLVPKSGVANLNLFVDQYIRRMSPVPVGGVMSYNLNP